MAAGGWLSSGCSRSRRTTVVCFLSLNILIELPYGPRLFIPVPAWRTPGPGVAENSCLVGLCLPALAWPASAGRLPSVLPSNKFVDLRFSVALYPDWHALRGSAGRGCKTIQPDYPELSLLGYTSRVYATIPSQPFSEGLPFGAVKELLLT